MLMPHSDFVVAEFNADGTVCPAAAAAIVAVVVIDRPDPRSLCMLWI